MDRLRTVARVWNWLPAFRAIAETEHLPTAAERLHVSASALSRTLRLLEDELGVPLFRRAGKRLELNEHGRRLLDATRDAVRLVHTGVSEVLGSTHRGPVFISCHGLMTTTYLPAALARLRARHPDLLPQVGSTPMDGLVEALLTGRLDVAFLSVPITDHRLTTQHLGQASNSIYCGPGHPLYEQREVALEEVLAHPFVAPPPDASGVTREGWPPHLRRRVVMTLSRMEVGVGVCGTGDVLAVIPDVVAARGERLWRLPIDLIPPTPLLALRRPTLGREGAAEAMVEAMAEEIGQG